MATTSLQPIVFGGNLTTVFQDIYTDHKIVEAGGMKFYIREGSSDMGVIEENIVKQPMLKHLTSLR